MKSLLLLLFLSTVACAQDRWILVCSSPDGLIDYYYDNESIQYEGKTVIVWEKTIKNCPKSYDNPNNDTMYVRLKHTAVKDLSESDWDFIMKKDEMWLNYSLHKRKYYCGERKYELSFTKDVYMDGSNSSKRNQSIFADAIPETVGELFYFTFCK